MKITVVGTGYVGLVSAACFAELGHTVAGVDIDEAKIKLIKSGKSPIYEPGLEELLQKNLKAGRLSFTTDLASVLLDAQIVFSAVATPPGEGHAADLKAVYTVAETVAQHMDHDLVFVNKSTVPVGTGRQCQEKMEVILKKRRAACRVAVISNPEFLREGMAVSDTLMPDRIIVGVNGEDWAADLMDELYRPITRVGKPLVRMSRESAEIVKYASNAFLATKISFMNMLTPLCEQTGANIRDVARGMGLDDRIGARFLHAGIGYGGSCFPKDVKALLATGKALNVPMDIVAATDAINRRQRERFIDLIIKSIPAKAPVAVWGLSFKPKTDDVREAPSLDIIPALVVAGHPVTAYDPAAMEKVKPHLPKEVKYAASALEAAKGAAAVVLLTEWDEFRGIELPALKKAMKGDQLIDGRNVYEPEDVKREGLRYYCLGISSH
jgi:UDPglucose 6-dehydrogenase